MRHEIQDTRFKKGGFTIVETLVAITILMIAVAGPLTVANQAFHAALDARNQMIATNLAQESVEELRNYKDNYLNDQNPLSSIFANELNGANNYYIQADQGGYELGNCATAGDGACSLYLDPSVGYTYSPTGSSALSPFKRSFRVFQITSTEYMIVVTVTWTTGGAASFIQVTDLLSSSKR